MAKRLTAAQYDFAADAGKPAGLAAMGCGAMFCSMFLDNYDYPPIPFYQDPKMFAILAVMVGLLITCFLVGTMGAPIFVRITTILGLIALAITNGWWNSQMEFKSAGFVVTFLLGLVVFPILVLVAQLWLLSWNDKKD